MAMSLELLPNEILLDVFGYLGGIQLLRAFYALNFRFNLLLYKEFRAYRFNFYFCPKRDFDMICQQHLPFLADRVTDLTLSGYDDTPEQINSFLSYIPSFSQFVRLRLLYLGYIRSFQTLRKIADQFHHLGNLERLILYCCSCQNNPVDLQLIMNNIWSLPKLSYFYSDVSFDDEDSFCLPTKLSTSLQDLNISQYRLNWQELYQLLKYTPRLKRLSVAVRNDENIVYESASFPILRKLIIRATDSPSTSKLISFLQNVPNLHRLHVYLLSNLINGDRWEQVIRNDLPKLKVFQLKMHHDLPADQNLQEKVNELLTSFRSSFWLVEREWFIRCFTYDKRICLQTLSNMFHDFEQKLPDSWQSTYPQDTEQNVYNTIQQIHDETFFDQSFPSSICLPNITHLCLKLPIHDKFYSIVKHLKNLRSLTISSYTDTSQSRLQALLNRAARLHTLCINRSALLPLQISLSKSSVASGRRLYLEDYYLSEEECFNLSGSPLTGQFDVLFVQVKNYESILILVENLINLRALHVKCEIESCNNQLSSTGNDHEFPDENLSNRNEVIQWLKDRLPSTSFISKDCESGDYIRIWIR